jgi:hypothetical protein
MFRTIVAALVLSTAALASAQDPGAEAAKSYRISTAGSTGDLKAGAAGTLVLAIEPIGKVHVHPQAPLKITLESSPGLTLGKTQLGHNDAVDPKAEGPRFEVPFTAAAAGKQEAKAKLDFFICSDQWCVKQTQNVVVPVNVKG